MIRNVNDFTNSKLYDEMIRNGEEKQSREELEAIVDEYNENASIFKKKSSDMLLKAYERNWKSAEKRYMKELNKQTKPNLDKEIKLEEKFGVQFQNKTWFECTIEEMKYSTFTNTNNRNVDSAYVIVEDTHLDIFKESVFLKTNMGNRKVYFQNVASIDYDARGKFHVSNSLIINLKSSEHVQLKNISEDAVQYVTSKFEQYLNGSNNAAAETRPSNNVDDLMKYAELYEKGLLTKEEFDMKKAEIMGTSSPISEIESSPKFCGNCGNPLEEDSRFCSNCGTQIKR